MATIHPTTQSVFWRVTRGNEVLDGITHLGELTGIAPDASEVHAEGEVAYVEALAPMVNDLDELPAMGTWLEQHETYRHGDAVVMVRQSHTRTEHEPATVPALFWTVNSSNEWIAGERVEVGTQRTYDGATYTCIQAHTTQADWTPPATPALWEAETPATEEWAAWTAYTIGDVVTYGGAEYECRQSHTSQPGWEPPNVLALWLPL